MLVDERTMRDALGETPARRHVASVQGRRRWRRRIAALRVGADALAFALAWIAAWGTRVLLSDWVVRALNPPEIYFKALPLVVVGSLLAAAAVGSYTPRRERGMLEASVELLKSAIGALLVAVGIGFFLKEFDFSRLLVLFYGLFSLLILWPVRALVDRVAQRLVKLGLLGKRVLIVGASETGVRTVQKVQDHPEIGYRVVGFLDDDPAKQGRRIARTPVLGPLARLREVVVSEGIDEVIFAIPQLEHERLMNLVMEIDDLAVEVQIVADLFGVLSRHTQIDLIEDVPIYTLKGPDESLLYRVGKRLFDLAVGGVAAIVFLVTLPLVALAIKLDSPGPVFFVQERVGKGGRIFRMWKYRTMYTDAEAYAVAPRDEDDPRVTRVGRFLRKTSLDELPQVINVLKGEMSIVGPRPEMPFIVETYNEWQRKRLEVKPGITGLWQILGRKDLPLHENLEYDFYYIKNRSLMLDVAIVLKTIPAIFTGKGAY